MKYEQYSDLAHDIFEECGAERTYIGRVDENFSSDFNVLFGADSARVTTKNEEGEITPIGKIGYGPEFAEDLRSLIRKFDEEELVLTALREEQRAPFGPSEPTPGSLP